MLKYIVFSSSDKESLSDSGGGGPGPKGTPTTEKVPFAKQGHVSNRCLAFSRFYLRPTAQYCKKYIFQYN